jgi:integrase
MAVRKRVWGEGASQRQAWVVDYFDGAGKRRLRTFKRKIDADSFAAKTYVDKRAGTHVSDSASITVQEAGKLWKEAAENENLERSTVDQYKQHLRLHIEPFLGGIKLTQLTLARVSQFETELGKAGRSPAMRRAILCSLGALIGNAQLLGKVGHNVVADRRHAHKPGKKTEKNGRHKRRLKVGVDIPTPNEAKALLAAAKGRWRPFLMTAVFAGMRASELRGLHWEDVDLTKGVLNVCRRADRYGKIGSPKSKAGTRTIPLPPKVISELRAWKLICPKLQDKHGHGRLSLVFPNGNGHVENLTNILTRGLQPTMIAAKLTVPKLDPRGLPMRDEDGQPILKAKYTGMHALRHFFTSWCINRKVDGGLELPAKVVQERLGHESIIMTMDRYGHLFPRGDDSAELAAAEAQLLG